MHANHDVTRFAHAANHVTIMSPVFTFHSCHVGMSWHEITGDCIGRTPCYHGLHHMVMM